MSGFNRARISIADQALQAMIMAALESYVIGNGTRPASGGRPAVENFGHLWGSHRRNRNGEDIYRVEVLDISISAVKKPSSVTPNGKAAQLKADFMHFWAPHAILLGDFHTHPYGSRQEIEKIRGYEYSPADRDALLHDDLVWEQSGNQPLMLIMSICELRKVHFTEGDWKRDNIYRFDIGQYRLWLTAAVGFEDENNKRCVTNNKNSPVFLDVGGRYNDTENRIRLQQG